MDDEGGGQGEVEEGLGGQVVVAELPATVEVGPGVEEQAHVQDGANERLVEVQVCEVVTGFAPPTLLTWREGRRGFICVRACVVVKFDLSVFHCKVKLCWTPEFIVSVSVQSRGTGQCPLT